MSSGKRRDPNYFNEFGNEANATNNIEEGQNILRTNVHNHKGEREIRRPRSRRLMKFKIMNILMGL